MSRLSDLLKQVESKDPHLAADLAREVKALSDRRAFGLNFERHVPEAVELPGRPVRRGDKVRLLAERGQRSTGIDQGLWRVNDVAGAETGRVATLVRQPTRDGEPETVTRSVDDLVVVAAFRDPIFPGLKSTGRVERGDDKPFHTVINAENYHALQALLYTHEGKIDAIYIDPPYNTGARDWKYNNDYVDADDAYRHSKWLAFIERRLKLAKRLLNPESSVLIVTIDEKEYLRLGLLLRQAIPDARIQMITTAIKPSGSRREEFSRVEEYIFFVMFGSAVPASTPNDMLWSSDTTARQVAVTWHGLRRRGSTDWKRSHRPNGFYPLFVSEADEQLVAVGEPIPLEQDRRSVAVREGTVAVWPLAPDGAEGRWQVTPQRFRDQLAEGTLALRSVDLSSGSASVVYLKSGDLRKIDSGEVAVDGRLPDGRVNVVGGGPRSKRPKTMWVMDSHDASTSGTALLTKFVGERRFPFPKSLYAVEDALRFFVGDKPDAVVLDFFAGSGTTAHAVMRLNRQDGGRRQCISVTNNEVSADEQARLRKQGLRQGDPEWEALGICEYITKPRLTAAVTGRTPDGEPVKGDYKFTDEFPMSEGFEENVAFFTMTYESPLAVAHNRAFEALAPLLWLKAGAQGRRIEHVADGFDVADTYAVLVDLDASRDFLAALAKSNTVRMAFIVTDDDRSYQMVCAELAAHVEPVRLYESYLSTFTLHAGRE